MSLLILALSIVLLLVLIARADLVQRRGCPPGDSGLPAAGLAQASPMANGRTIGTLALAAATGCTSEVVRRRLLRFARDDIPGREGIRPSEGECAPHRM